MSTRESTVSIYRATYRKRRREERVNFVVSVTAFFGAICVIGWFGLSAIGGSDEDAEGARIVIAGGAPQVVSAADAGRLTSHVPAARVAEENYVVGDFGDPASDFYRDDDNAGWGQSSLQASRSQAGSSGTSARN
ncbi:hypothetical protein [Aurantiacibacter poecillastricola]|uniref:hypothetical protein n=1 Tax=Aurantiacibacter poecillastricola TaxID=3064385 RepID=UPI00273EB9B2|nr:hypothetical protein [Aurantiacibacter sp. 219JJ12-13]MDP5262987.1 hypothetical protein [Aurantiacibacter sp. 219JJ12-13]